MPYPKFKKSQRMEQLPMWSLLEKLIWMDGWVGFWARFRFRRAWRTVKTIPDPEKLWRVVHNMKHYKTPTGRVKRTFFMDKNGLSCDMARFSTEGESLSGHEDPPHWNGKVGLVEWLVSHVREAKVDVMHDPMKEPVVNYSHSMLDRNETTCHEVLEKKHKVVVDPKL